MYSIAMSASENASVDPAPVQNENSDGKPDSGIQTTTAVASTDDNELVFTTAITSTTSKDD